VAGAKTRKYSSNIDLLSFEFWNIAAEKNCLRKKAKIFTKMFFQLRKQCLFVCSPSRKIAKIKKQRFLICPLRLLKAGF
jgi:hypothetical protein